MNEDTKKKKLEGYTECKPADIKNLETGDRIRYETDKELKLGGIIKFIKPELYLVLLNPINKATWSVQLKEPTLKVWVRKKKTIQKEQSEMKKIYEMFKEGKLEKVKNKKK
tara:strand:- start:2641 stop:2973 length:333 start_codon:yes stop_codon:yes gene_type:complete